ncbi:hypothetical protein ACFMQL_20285 [Nonomuraea fastidiosa]|uniref:hypothetical protein n=1 Tax=Nonomuraea fastidiosa TaxID=46173 RepID=UPI003672BDB3
MTTTEEQFGIDPNDPLGMQFTDDVIQMLVGQRNSLLGQADQVRQQADKEISALRARARQLDALIQYARSNRGTSGGPLPDSIECRCGRIARWATGYGWYHDVNGKSEPAGDQCKSEPLPSQAEPARLPEPSRP